ncbi:MAG: class I SAM-dependent methyltransferase [Pseudomonadota bacterium]|nr:class I SAM-dependent methyltransferase [Pseudomonadota bacterium]
MTKSTARVPNRTLDLHDLDLPIYRAVLAKMDELKGKEAVSYLHPSKRWEYPWALERAQLARGSHILDAGCGASIFPIYLATQGYQVTALDLNLSLNLARLHDVSVNYVRGKLTALPLADNAFDAVFCISVIEHLGRDGIPAALNELRRVVRFGGKVLLTTDYYEDAEAELWYEGPGESFRVDWNFFDESLLRRLVLQAPGLRVEGAVDLAADWEIVRVQMRRFHGYPYTSVGVALAKV